VLQERAAPQEHPDSLHLLLLERFSPYRQAEVDPGITPPRSTADLFLEGQAVPPECPTLITAEPVAAAVEPEEPEAEPVTEAPEASV
jgi:hypothetical protein